MPTKIPDKPTASYRQSRMRYERQAFAIMESELRRRLGEARLFHSLLVETLAACNRTCWFCKFGQPADGSEVTRMPWSTIERIVSELSEIGYAGRLSWFRINEPLLDKRIQTIIELSRSRLPCAFLSLVTNGDRLDRAVLDGLLSAGLDQIGVSVYDDATLARLDDLFRNPAVVVLDRRGDWGTASADNRAGNIPEARMGQRDPTLELSCGRPSSLMSVMASGDVVLCCSDFHADVVCGNVNDQRLVDIWNGSVLTAYRRRLRNGRSGLRLCESCTHSGAPHPRFFPLPG